MKGFYESARVEKLRRMYQRRYKQLQRRGFENYILISDNGRPTHDEIGRIGRHIHKHITHGTRRSVDRKLDIMWKNASYMQKVIMNTDYWEFNSIPEEDVHSVMEQAKVGDLNRAIKRLGWRATSWRRTSISCAT